MPFLLRSLGGREITLLIVIVVYSFIPTVGGLFRISEIAGIDAGFMPENPRALAQPIPIVLHTLASFVFCFAGALQFLPSLRRHHLALHRMNGRVVALAGVISAATGLWMTVTFTFPPDIQGDLLYWVRIFLSISMMALIGWAVMAIKSRNIAKHSAAMLRSYAIGQGASTQAILGIGWIVATGIEPSGLFRDWLMVSAWILNFLVAETLIAKWRR